ncbi:MAG: TRAP transporter small permease subunit [Chromatiales bacterium]|jgi:TRAP-type C4-dicarboxylate transport system permease small subunit|nr:TRAP transporter small permease subunit [Chromatiales bacterium]
MFIVVFVSRWLRRLNDLLAVIATGIGMAVIGFACLALFIQVVERHVTGQGYAWMSDFPPFLVPWCVFPLMGVLLREDQHIKVEVAPNMLKGKALVGLKLFIGVICLVSGVYFCWAGTLAVQFFVMLGEITETEIEIPFWYLYAAFPVGFGVFSLFALERVLEQGLELIGHPVSGSPQQEGAVT